jgi:hypothetical protein
MIAYYPFNPGSGFLEDVSGQAGALINVGGVSALPGVRDGVANISNANTTNPNPLMQHLILPQFTLPSNSSTCLWFNPQTSVGDTYILDMSGATTRVNGYFIRSLTTTPTCVVIQVVIDRQSYGVAWNSANCRSGFVVNKWTHVCLSVSGNTFNTYLDGVLYMSTVLAVSMPALNHAANTRYLGRALLPPPLFNGYMDDVRFFSRPLSASEAAALYNFNGDTYTPVMPLGCDAGTFSTAVGSSDPGTCVPCAAGLFQSAVGSTRCVACDAGTFSSLIGASVCAACAAGSYSTAIGSSNSTCTPCPANTVSGAGATACQSQAGYYNLGGSLLAYYPFNPGSTFLEDVSGQAGALINNGGVAGTVGGRDGVANIANADITNPNPLMQYLGLPQITLPSNFSACMWIQPLVQNPNTVFFSLENSDTISNGLRVRNSASASLPTCLIWQPIVGGTFPGSTTVDGCKGYFLNQWSHVCASISGTLYTGYLDGMLYATATLPSAMPVMTYASGNGWIGRGRRSTPLYSGYIDEVRIFNRALSAAEAAAVYQFSGDTYTPVLSVGCSAGTYSTAVGSVNPDTCAQCPAGTYSTAVGATSVSVCVACKSCDSSQLQVSTCPEGSSSDSVTCLCQPGNYTSAALLSPAVCSTCAAGTYASSYYATVCSICSAGTYASSVSTSGCVNCSAGTYGFAGTCKPCPSHTVSEEGGVSVRACTCEAGYSCAYTKTLTLTLFLNLTVGYADVSGLLGTPEMLAVAVAAGVPVSSISVGTVSPVQGRRRLHTHQVRVFIDGCQKEVGEGHWADVRYADAVEVRRVVQST